MKSKSGLRLKNPNYGRLLQEVEMLDILGMKTKIADWIKGHGMRVKVIGAIICAVTVLIVGFNLIASISSVENQNDRRLMIILLVIVTLVLTHFLIYLRGRHRESIKSVDQIKLLKEKLKEREKNISDLLTLKTEIPEMQKNATHMKKLLDDFQNSINAIKSVEDKERLTKQLNEIRQGTEDVVSKIKITSEQLAGITVNKLKELTDDLGVRSKHILDDSLSSSQKLGEQMKKGLGGMKGLFNKRKKNTDKAE